MSQLTEVFVTTVQAEQITTATLQADLLSTVSIATPALSVSETYVTTVEVGAPVQFGNHDIAITSTGNVLVGSSLPAGITTGTKNVCLGVQPGRDLTTGSSNVLLSDNAGLQITSQNENIAIGANAMSGAVTGNQNICIGSASGLVAINDNNIALGRQAINQAGSNNIVVGVGAGSLGGATAIGNDNILLGPSTSQVAACDKTILIGASAQTTGAFNNSIAIGYQCKAAKANTIYFGRDNAAPNQNYNRLFLGNVPMIGTKSNIIPGPYANDALAAAGTPLGGLYFNSVGMASQLCIRLT